MTLTVDEFLEHHGVKGMKWGVRHDPRVLARNTVKSLSDARVNSAKKNDSNAAAAQKRIDELKTKTGFAYNRQAQIHNLNEYKQVQEAKAKAKRDHKLTPGQKKALIGAAAVGVLVAAYAGYKVADLGIPTSALQQGKDLINGEKGLWRERPILAEKDLSLNQIQSIVVNHVNPNYGDIGTKNNCRRATFAYEMRRRGFDVRATKSIVGSGQTAGGLVKAATEHHLDVPTTSYGIARQLVKERAGQSKAKDNIGYLSSLVNNGIGKDLVMPGSGGDMSGSIFKHIGKHPDGSRGELGVHWSNGGGHSMAWEIIKGKPVIIDAQSGIMYKSANEFLKLGMNVSDAATTRLDNIPLNHTYLSRWLTNA